MTKRIRRLKRVDGKPSPRGPRHYDGHKKNKMKVPRLRGVHKDRLSEWVPLTEG